MRLVTKDVGGGRGLWIASLKDFGYNQDFEIQDSSLADGPCIWIGVKGHRAHLTREMAAAIIPVLRRFVKNGRLKP